MKSRLAGRRYTKRTVTEYDVSDPAELFRWAKDMQTVSFFDEHVQNIKAWAESVLNAEGIPAADRIYRAIGSKEYTGERPKDIDGKPGYVEARLIHTHVEFMGYERDSQIGFAARALYAIYMMENAKSQELIIQSAFELGTIAAFSDVYGVNDYGSSSGGKKGTRTQPWITEVVEWLNDEYPERSAQFIWNRVPNSHAPIDINDYEVYRDNDRLCIAGEHGKVAFSVFKRHLSIIRKKV